MRRQQFPVNSPLGSCPVLSGNRKVQARYAPFLPSAAWKLVEVLHCLKQGDQVLAPSFYDGIILLSREEKLILKQLPDSEETLNRIYGAESRHYEKDFYQHLLEESTFNICWLKSGAR